MGFLRFALSGLLLLVPMAAGAQSGTGRPVFTLPPGSARPSGPEREGPEIDVPRDTGPPAGQPQPVTPPPVASTVTPTRPATAPVRRPAAPLIEERRPARTPAAPTARPVEAAPQPAPAPTPSPRATPAPAAQPAPVPARQPAPAAPPAGWTGAPWIIAGLVALVALLAALFLRRRPKRGGADPAPDTPQADPAPPARRPDPPVSRPSAPPPSASRPRLTLTLEIRSARLSLMGVTISYALFVENAGDVPADDIFIRGLVMAAGDAQQAAMARFFRREAGEALHSVAGLAPGETYSLAGDLRIASAEIATIELGGRGVLVPLVAFDAEYGWDAGTGRTVRAFIVGQEQDPPTDRLAPLRVDLGPRHYRGAACRATTLDLTR